MNISRTTLRPIGPYVSPTARYQPADQYDGGKPVHCIIDSVNRWILPDQYPSARVRDLALSRLNDTVERHAVPDRKPAISSWLAAAFFGSGAVAFLSVACEFASCLLHGL